MVMNLLMKPQKKVAVETRHENGVETDRGNTVDLGQPDI
jgi:hypothetical protein